MREIKLSTTGYPLPIVWFAVIPYPECTNLEQGAATFGEACELLFKMQAEGYKEAHILLTMRI